MIAPGAIHVAVDMQRLFAEATDWLTPTFDAVLPNVVRLTAHRPERTIMTRFLVPPRGEDAKGAWRDYYRRWSRMTLATMNPAMHDVVAPLQRFVPPAALADKTTYSAFASGDFVKTYARLGGDGLILSGVETDVCVLATAYAAVDRGIPVVIATDAVTASDVPSHQVMLDRVYARLPEQIALMTTAEVLARWRP